MSAHFNLIITDYGNYVRTYIHIYIYIHIYTYICTQIYFIYRVTSNLFMRKDIYVLVRTASIYLKNRYQTLNKGGRRNMRSIR